MIYCLKIPTGVGFLNHIKHNRKLLQEILRTFVSKADKIKCKQDPATAVTECTIQDCMVDPCKPEPSIVIIGAGIAGLSAAERLATCGITNFTILEATDRPGGRIHSCWLGDVIAELGCGVIEGPCAVNPVFNLAAQEGLVKHPIQKLQEAGGLFCTSDGRAIENSVVNMVNYVFSGILREASNLFSMGCNKQHGSLQHFLTMRVQQEIQKFPEDMRYDASRVFYGQINAIRSDLGDDLTSISADNFGSSISIPGGKTTIPIGFISILGPLLRKLPECTLRYNKPVGLIRWGTVQEKAKGPRAIVQCCDGEEFCADYVIVTMSLGVLKEHGDKLFCPALPSTKMDAIKSLGYAHIDKVFLDYDRPFWVWSEGTINLAWSADELSKRTDWTRGISKITEVPASKHVLEVSISGPEASVMEHATDEEVARDITRLLRQFTGDATLPYPNSVLRSKWVADPYFCGSKSYIKVQSHIGHQCDLSMPVPGTCEPIPPILLFAGEAAIAGYHGTVHGARLSGIREAERILQLTKKFGGPPPKCS
ncbi:unnamed protein product [Brassicogethes aeneus]|uniref:Amine oxidase domain-containing protein n=1 Tax=Brassicogethes aeneus TaxID=1431903 RepID=A0A9P0B919_BRAAE|nr:unnamed protein product [Brassicogethes aeneus]